ncbi:MAG: hypothetical protein JWN17_1284 [Frankiales bacterium]|nr:hypothetical protein [Frankiales bacterium]
MNAPTPSAPSFGRLGGRLSLGLVALGLLAILLGYNGAAGNLDVRAQLPYVVSGGFVGISLVVLGAALMITQGAREDRQRMEALLVRLVELGEQGTSAGSAVPAGVDGLFAAGTASYHRPGCRLVDGREEVGYVTGAEALARDLTPCRVCRPQDAAVSIR